jgi:hypothetical protein
MILLTKRTTLRLVAVLVLMVVTFSTYGALWLWEAQRTQRAVLDWITAHRAAGMTILAGPPTVGGFPFRIRIRLDQVSITGIAELPGASVSVPLLTGSIRPWALGHWTIQAPNGIGVGMSDETIALHATYGAANLAFGSAAPNDGTLVDLHLTGIEGHVPDGPVSAAVADLSVALPSRPPSDRTLPSVSMTLSLADASLPKPVGPLGATISTARLQGSIMGVIPPGSPSAALAQWRDAGGTIELNSAAVTWGPLDGTAEGTLALDGDMQPIAALTATIRGYDAILDALAGAGQLKPNEAAFARMGLSIIAQRGPSGKSELKAPIRVQNGQVNLGPARIAKLPRLAWK